MAGGLLGSDSAVASVHLLTGLRSRHASEIPERYDLFINNEWHQSSSNATLEARSPLTGDVLCTVPDASERDVVEAVIAAKAAWPRLASRSGPRKRAEA